MSNTQDEIRVSKGKLIKRVSDWITLDGSESGWSWTGAGTTYERAILNISDSFPGGGVYSPDIYCYSAGESGWNDTKTGLVIDSNQHIRIYRPLNNPSATLQDFRNWLGQNPIRLIYQLNDPIILDTVEVEYTENGQPSDHLKAWGPNTTIIVEVPEDSTIPTILESHVEVVI